ncbi:Retrovirus-related Pol polyprotein from transposon TNT 1-94 [Senna tora]|uniref:Retrovirus-related Pol polyprotein from transposon TNT 1-94 n=1 Tax=Senna tora TaxID=362788 RepID=A0A834SE21_9FABA|nr:Retrovirus-related Pol polyprotein from transposon TNT 1-94 [Senna tora]
MLAHGSLPFSFSEDAFVSATYIINMLPCSTLSGQSPFVNLFNTQPDYAFLRVFGCSCFPLLRPFNKHKMEFRTHECVFIGYSPSHKGYNCLSPSGHVFLSRDVRFNESVFPYPSLFSSPLPSNPLSHCPSVPSNPPKVPSLPTAPCPLLPHDDMPNDAINFINSLATNTTSEASSSSVGSTSAMPTVHPEPTVHARDPSLSSTDSSVIPAAAQSSPADRNNVVFEHKQSCPVEVFSRVSSLWSLGAVIRDDSGALVLAGVTSISRADDVYVIEGLAIQ